MNGEEVMELKDRVDELIHEIDTSPNPMKAFTDEELKPLARAVDDFNRKRSKPRGIGVVDFVVVGLLIIGAVLFGMLLGCGDTTNQTQIILGPTSPVGTVSTGGGLSFVCVVTSSGSSVTCTWTGGEHFLCLTEAPAFRACTSSPVSSGFLFDAEVSGGPRTVVPTLELPVGTVVATHAALQTTS